MRALLACAFVFANLVPAKAMTAEELVNLARKEIFEKEAWQKRCSPTMYPGPASLIPAEGLTRECAESQPKGPSLFNRLSQESWAISGPITCKVFSVKTYTLVMSVANLYKSEVPEDIMCVTESGFNISINNRSPECEGGHNIEGLSREACFTEPVYKGDVITVETTSAIVLNNPIYDPFNDGASKDPVVLHLGGEFAHRITLTVNK